MGHRDPSLGYLGSESSCSSTQVKYISRSVRAASDAQSPVHLAIVQANLIASNPLHKDSNDSLGSQARNTTVEVGSKS